jgi:predicted ATPase/class 3 adenylate cyclase
MPELPRGTVTFLFTDVEGSTRLWAEHPAAMPAVLRRHDALIEREVVRCGGVVVRPRGEGDSRFAVFARAGEAVAAAAALQQALHAEPWPAALPLRVRVALHTGDAELWDGDYYGSAVNRCARLRAIAHGGQTLLSQATYDLVRDALPAGVRVRDLGEHRLSDLQRLEQVFQLLAGGLPTEFPPLRSLESLPNNLPLQLTSFVGREKEMGAVRSLLTGTRLLTLTGPGGTGKTRLAVHLAADLLERYPQGVWLVELAPLADPALVPQALATVLGVREDANRPLPATLAEVLRPKQLLLLLDNCEHLIEACAQLADALLRACPHVQVLATSREALGIAGETAWRVPSLALPAPQHLPPLESLLQSEAVRLFVDRAVAAQPHFALTATNTAAVAQICRRLDGIPLALELAAARVRGLSVEQLAARLDHRFRLLTGGSRAALPRQQTLRATVDWSYALLTPQEQMLFTRLSVFAGGWTVEAAEVVCAGGEITAEDVLALLLRLVDKALVEVEEEQASGARYRLLETLRQYGREQLVARGEAGAVHLRHAAYYLALAEQAEPALRGPDQVAWLDRLEVEHDNLRAALAWSLEAQAPVPPEAGAVGDAEVGLRLAGALWFFWFLHGHRREGLRWLEQALGTGQGGPAARAKALMGAGFIAWDQDERARAQPLVEASAALYRELGDTANLARVLGGISLYLRDPHAENRPLASREEYREGTAVLEEGVRLAREVGDPWLLATVLSYAAYSAAVTDPQERESARVAGEEALLLFQTMGDTFGIALTQRSLGWVALQERDYARAHQAFAADLAASRVLKDSSSIARALDNLGQVAQAEGDQAGAAALYEESLAVLREMGIFGRRTGHLLHKLGVLALAQGDSGQAGVRFAESLRTAGEVGDHPQVAAALDALAGVAAAQGAPRRAVQLAGTAAALRARAGLSAAEEEQDTFPTSGLTAARAVLSAETQAAAWAEGQALTPEQAIAAVLDNTPLGSGPAGRTE